LFLRKLIVNSKKTPLSFRMTLCSALIFSLMACGGGSGGSVSPDTGTSTVTDEARKTPHPVKSQDPASSPTTEPAPTEPAPAEPTPVNPAPTEPTPIEPTPEPVTIAGPVSSQQLQGDMTLAHESTVHGVNPAWSWGSKPRMGVGVNFPSGYEDPHFVPWGIAANATSGNPARNARVQIRKIILDVKRNGTWSRIVYNTNDSQIMGSLYTNYETNTTAPANVRKHGADGISVKLPDSGGSFHFMTTNRFRIAYGAQEIVSRIEARLIVDDTSKTDDRALAKLLVGQGGDIWRSASAQWNPNTLSNVDFAIGRFKYVTNEWSTFSAHTLTSQTEINDYLAKESSLSPR
jgi:hypothetical protein